MIVSLSFEAHPPPIGRQTKENVVPCGKFRLVENDLQRGLFEWNFAVKAEFHLLAAFFVGPGKNVWCNISPVFSGHFLIASFSQETPCQKVEAHMVQRRRDWITTQANA